LQILPKFAKKTDQNMAKDLYHDAVRKALEADGWTITDDPYHLKAKPHKLRVDLGAEKVIAAEKGVDKIAVEIKTFAKDSFIYEFYEVSGQYQFYEEFLAEQESERILYLAISEVIYRARFLRDESVMRMCQKIGIKFIIVNMSTQIIKEWTK
jgi:XisH protein